MPHTYLVLIGLPCGHSWCPGPVLKGESIWPGLKNLSEHPSFLPKGSLHLGASSSKLGTYRLHLLLNVLWSRYCRVVKMLIFLSSIYLPTYRPAYTPSVESRNKRWGELCEHCWDACLHLCLKSSLYLAFPINTYFSKTFLRYVSLPGISKGTDYYK